MVGALLRVALSPLCPVSDTVALPYRPTLAVFILIQQEQNLSGIPGRLAGTQILAHSTDAARSRRELL